MRTLSAIAVAVLGGSLTVGCTSGSGPSQAGAQASKQSVSAQQSTSGQQSASGQQSPVGSQAAGSGPIPATVSSVDVTLTRNNEQQSKGGVLTGEAAEKIAAVINGLPPASPIFARCMTDRGARDNLMFHDGSSVISVEVKLDPCGWVRVRRDGGVPMSYNGAATVNAEILKALGLSPTS